MSSQNDPTAVAVARAHVEAWGSHDYDSARASLAPDVHVVVTSVDPEAPRVDTTGIEGTCRVSCSSAKRCCRARPA